jgi:phosphate transport system substrate-binding protein
VALNLHLELAVENQRDPVAQAAAPAKRRLSVVRLLVIVVVGLILACGIYFAPRFLNREEPRTEYPKLQLGGTSAIFGIAEDRWKGKYREAKGVEIAYTSTGTTAGVNRLIDGTDTIVFTHGPLSKEQRQKAREKGGEVVHIPVLICGVAPVYNVKELKGKAPLKLTGELLVDIFLGKITEWNHPALKAANPGLELPPTKIVVVHRKDSSGTTQLFTEYLDAVHGNWRDKVGPPAAEVKWPVGEAAARNLGVAALVDKTEGAIGYVDRLFTTYEDMVLDYAAVETKDKTGFVRAEMDNITAAAAGVLADLPEDLTFNLANKPGKDAYPICGVIYAVCYQTQPAATKQQVVDFLRWVTHDGQPHAANLSYAPLPAELVRRIDQRLESIKAAP